MKTGAPWTVNRGPWSACLLAAAGLASPLAAQDTRGTVRQMEGSFQALRFTPPTPRQVRLSNGVQVFLMEDRTLPQVSISIVGRHGVANLPDSLWAAGWQADGLMRTGGTTTLTPDSVDKLVEFYALQVGFQTAQENSNAFGNSLTRNSGVLLDLLFDMMRNPRNDTSRIREVQGQVEEGWRRRNDQPGGILGRAWSQVMMGDHPLGRSIVKPEEAALFTPERIRAAQNLLFCPERLVVGVTGDFTERDMVQQLERRFRGWARCPAGNREVPPLRFADGPRIVLVEKDVNQSNIRIGQAGGLRVADTPEYFAAQVADFLLGGGGGFNSRLLQTVRSDSGFAYSVFSNWGAEVRREAAFFAGAQTRANKTVAAISLIRDIIGSMVTRPVTADDVQLAKDAEINAFVFRFENPSQVVGQQVQYVVDGLPANWFDIYLRGIQAVTPDQVTQVVRQRLDPSRMVTVVVGNPASFDGPLDRLGTVTTLPVDQIIR